MNCPDGTGAISLARFKVGDRITFKSATRSDYKKATRKIVSIDDLGRPRVRYHGWDNFIVMPTEILDVEKAD